MSNYLTEEQLAEFRQRRAPGLASFKEQKIRDLARDLHEGRIPVAVPSVAAALRELVGEIEKVLPS